MTLSRTAYLAAALAGAIAAASVAATAAPAVAVGNGSIGTTVRRGAAVARNVTTWPFSRSSIWNLPVATTSLFQASTARQTANLADPKIGTGINAKAWSVPVYQATATDPLASFHWVDIFNGQDHGTFYFRMPANALPAGGTDANIDVIDPDRLHVHEIFYAHGQNPSWTVGNYIEIDLAGSGFGPYKGIRAYGGSTLGGLVRQADVQAGVIRHALAMAALTTQLYAYDINSTCRGWVWPAISQDDSACETSTVGPYSGLNAMGTYAAIPRSVDLNSLGLVTAQGRMMAQAAQDYGVYVVDRCVGGDVFYAEPAISANWLQGLRSDYDLDRLRHSLRVVSNNGPATPNGGAWDSTGRNRVAALAPLP